MVGKMLVSESLAMRNKSRQRKLISMQKFVLMNVAILPFLFNPTASLAQMDEEGASNSEEIASSKDEDSSATGDVESDTETHVESEDDEPDSSQSDIENQTGVDSSKEESVQSDEDGSDEDDIAENFIPSEEISEDIAVPFPVDI